MRAWGRWDRLSRPPQRLRQIMEVNFFAPAELTRHALPLLRCGERPIVVNIGSILGHCAVPGKSEYCASKFALHGWSERRFELPGRHRRAAGQPEYDGDRVFRECLGR